MKDRFSQSSDNYQRFRPSYPPALFAELARLASGRQRLWDCGCGTGQASLLAADSFQQVVATDLSAAQVGQGLAHERVNYLACTAEAAPLANASCDAVLVAQALHWFDFSAFFAEAERVLRPGGVLAALTYNLLSIAPGVDELIAEFYHRVIGAYWDAERRHVENAYADIPFPWQGVDLNEFAMTAQWSPEHLLGYLRTWSAVKNYQRERDRDPVAMIEPDVLRLWPQGVREVRWPLTVRVRFRP